MKVKFGFLVNVLQEIGGGTYDPLANFREVPIAQFFKKVGDTVESADELIEIATDKVNIIFSLEKLCKVKNGTIIAIDYERAETWRYDGIEELPDGDKMFLPELGWIETDETAARELPNKGEGNQPEKPEEKTVKTERVRAAPATRKLAREHGIDINTIQGTGIDGRVMKVDVERAIAEKHLVPEKKQFASDEVILLTPSREWLTVAHNLEKGSKTTIAAGEPMPLGEEEYDLSELLALRTEYREAFEKEFGVPFHVSAPVIFAAIRALCIERFWIFNSYWYIEDENDRNKDKVALYTSVNMGISVDFGIEPKINLEEKTIGGQRLRIATLKKANELSLREFLMRHHDLMSRVRADTELGKLKATTLGDWGGHSFICNNVGAARHKRGISLFTPRISTMLNMGTIAQDGKTVFQIFFDHRMIDGVPSTRFMDAVYEELMMRILPELKLACARHK